MIERWIYGIGALAGDVEPEFLPVPRIKREAVRIGWPVEGSGPHQVIACNMAMRSYRGEGIVISRLAPKAGEHASFHFRRAQTIREISLEDRRRPDFDKDAEIFIDKARNRFGEANGAPNIPPPIVPIERFVRYRFAGY